VGLLAAGLAAIYPQLFVIDGTVIADSLYAPLVVLILLLAYRLLDRRSVGWAIALGAAIGLATLTRPEGLLFLPLLAAPVAWRAGAGWRRLTVFGACAAAAVLVLTPWLVRNQIAQDRFPLISTNGALTQAATNNDVTFYGPRTGFVCHTCEVKTSCWRIKDEIAQSECVEDQSRRYIRAHLARFPVVVAAREGRLWNVYDPGRDLRYSGLWARGYRVAFLGLIMYAAMVPFALAGALILRRRRVPLLPLLVPFAVAAVIAAATFGFSRYRLVADLSLVVLAAVSLDALISRWSERRRVLGDERPGRRARTRARLTRRHYGHDTERDRVAPETPVESGLTRERPASSADI
jgi:4-amino-4-deoxy-L-arabinose transferase-like glycosyltransferase